MILCNSSDERMWNYRLPQTPQGWALVASWVAALVWLGEGVPWLYGHVAVWGEWVKWLAWGMLLVPLGVTAYVLIQMYQEQRWKSERFTNRG